MGRWLSACDMALSERPAAGYYADQVMRDIGFDKKIQRLWAQKQAHPDKPHDLIEQHRNRRRKES